MSFAREFTICRHSSDSAAMPTDEELQLSQLVRPGMKGGRRIEQILLPGKYTYMPAETGQYEPVHPTTPDVTEARRHSIRSPRLVRVQMASWLRYQELVWTAFLASTIQEVTVPVDKADDAKLGYYNCRILKRGDVISLDHRSIITDFVYRDDYFAKYVIEVLGGSSIEQHSFAHVDTPRDPRSGHLVLGKVVPGSQSLELTAFSVQPGDSVYIPGGTIHTNDYLLGRWETLLSSACEFPIAKVMRPGNRSLQFIIGHNLE